MGIIAIYISVDNETLKNLRDLKHEELSESLETLQWDESLEHMSIYKVWDGLHFLLTGITASLPIAGDGLSEFILGVNLFSDDEELKCIGYSTSDEIETIFKEIDNLDFSKLRETFDPSAFHENEIYPDIWKDSDEEELWEELEDTYNSLVKFYKKNANHGVIVTIR